MSVFEIIMLLSFGVAWPPSIYKSLKSKSTKGKSFIFLVVVMIGYISGILNKIFYSFDFVIVLYCINLIMVTTDTIIYIRNLRLEKNNIDLSQVNEI